MRQSGSGDLDTLKQRVQQLEAEVTALQQENARLKEARNNLGSEAELPVAVSEFEETLRRLVQRTAMIVQAEKCVIMVKDRDTGDLFARTPAFGISDDEVRSFRISPQLGISGEVFRSGHPGIIQDAHDDPRALREGWPGRRIRNGITVPLIVERRDEENRVTESLNIGVLHCFNKRYGGDFIEEDVRLLERLSRNAAAVIANAQMFQEIFEEKQKLVHTLESLTAGLIFVNQHQRIGQMNAQARTMFQVTEDPLGKPMEEVIRHEECLTILKRKLDEAENPPLVEDPEVEKKPDEITVMDEEGNEYIYQFHSAQVRDDSNSPIGTVVIFNDITELRNVERMKTEFVSIVSHELRTPLTPMKGFVRTLLDDENEEWYNQEDRREFYGIIEQNVDRLGRLINDLLNVSRIERGVGIEMNWDAVDIQKATEEVLETQKGRTDKHTFVVDFQPENLLVDTDPDIIHNILHNLLSNAIKYAPEGGEVRVIGRQEEPTEKYPRGSMLIGVKDEGLGIPGPFLEKLGKKFVRITGGTHSKIHGTGIGLYLVTNLVAAHQGEMWPESEGPGKGSTFWFRIPLKQLRTEEAEPVQE